MTVTLACATEAAAGFRFGSSPLKIRPFGQGHINETFLVSGKGNGFVLQCINTTVFLQPERVMDNIAAVTTHSKTRILAAGGDVRRETLALISTHQGGYLHKIPGSGDDRTNTETFWRAYHYINNARSYGTVQGEAHVMAVGKVVGNFLRRLEDMPVAQLHETIPNFHNTPKRMDDFKNAAQYDTAGRANQCRAEIDFVLARAKHASRITSGLANGSIPQRASHNDTKLDNVLVDVVSGAGLCLVDLDTVMPGSALYDFGDCVRSLATAREDEIDLSLVHFDLRRFEVFCAAYLSAAGDILTPIEKHLLPYSAWLMTFECGLRFLADHLNGDVYFKIRRPNHNLQRARNQFHHITQIEASAGHLEAIVAGLL
jgi:hypothetical protein